MVQDDAPVGLDRVEVVFDDERVVSDAGIVLVATLAGRLGIEALVGRFVTLRRDRPGAANAGRKVMALVYAMLLGADSIDDCEVLRAGRTRRLLGGWLPAPSTLGTFLRAFTFGHVRQLDRLLGETLTRAWRAGAGPGEGRLVVDVDSFIGEVHGYQKQGVGFGYTKRRGYHPMLASRADTGEVLHVRLRKGQAASPRGVLRFADELIARVERAGASGTKLLRADSAFWNKKLMARLQKAGWLYSISVRLQFWVTDAIASIPESDWITLQDYPADGEAQIAQTIVAGQRLVVRRTRLVGAQAELWPDWRYFPFLTNRTDPLAVVEAEHRQHAVVELTVRDLKDQALAHFPSGQFAANSAWTVIACLAHNLTRWTSVIGLPGHTIRAARTLRRRLLQIPGRLTRTARQWTLHLPSRWPWQDDFTDALTRIRALPAA
ncbi:MAG TPA: IS1380 family transposase [Solirubrobacteraceae bacterium]|nr:IS1380 family transposase [Solirubrobacteraceae bacterium]